MSPAQAATLTVPKLKAELSELGLPTSGLKAVLLERLQAALSEPAAASPGAPAAAAARKSAASKAAASEPRVAPTPKPLAAKRGRSWRAGRPGAQPTLAGWRTGPPPPAHNSRLPPAAPNGSSAGSRARGFSLLSAARLPRPATPCRPARS